MPKKKIFLILITLVLSISNLSASSSYHDDFSIKISKVKETYWDADVPEQLLLQSFHEVDMSAIKGASELLKYYNLSDKERRIQQAILQHEDAKLAFNLACQEYSILVEERKIAPCEEKVSPKTFAYLNLVKDQEEIKIKDPEEIRNNPFLCFPDFSFSSTSSYHSPDRLDPSYVYLAPYIYDPTQNDFEVAQTLFDKLNRPVLYSKQGALSNSEFQIPNYHLGGRKSYFVDDFQGDDQLEAAYAVYTKRVNGGAGLNDMDVHAYNRKFNFKDFLPTILRKDNISISTDSALTVVEEMKKTFVYKCYPKQITLNKSFSRLLGHLKQQKVEVGETSVDVEKILSRIWSLIVNNPYEIENLFMVFCDNEETHGGCFPGHAGRLADFYVKVLRKEHFTKQIIYYE